MTDRANDPLDGDLVLQQVRRWAESRGDVRAVLLTSTRTRPGAALDPFSDYDVILAVTDVHPYFDDRGWLGDFGPVLVVYRDPIRVEHGCERFALITLYEKDRLKIDFTVMQAGWLAQVAQASALPDELDVGYRVLLDKDDLTGALPPPTYRAFVVQPPTAADYHELVEVFFHEATYVAKHLWRDDLLPAKYCLDQMMKGSKLRRMLEWLAGCNGGWTYRSGALGKGLKRHVPANVWAALERTYVGADPEENWGALFATIDLFRAVGIGVGQRLGYAYPDDLHRRTVAYLRDVQRLDREG